MIAPADVVTADILIVGAGSAGLPAAISAAAGGASVAVIEAAEIVGGTLHLSAGQISAAGTPEQRRRGIADDPDRHYADILRISRGTADPALTRLAVDHLPGLFSWLTQCGVEWPADHPVIDPVNEPYSVPRTSWHADGGRAILRALLPRFEAACASERVALHLGTRVTGLVVEGGRAVAARAQAGDRVREFRAGAIVLASGGFTSSPAMAGLMTGGRVQHGRGHDRALGEGLACALAVGGVPARCDRFLPAYAAVEAPTGRDGFAFETRVDPVARPPWEVHVDLAGRRFMREDEPDLNRRQRALLGVPDLRFWAIYDAVIERDAPPFPARGWRSLDARFGERLPGYVEADSVAGLARAMAVDPVVLERTLTEYNDALSHGRRDPFGRRHRPCPIAEPPLRAIRHSGWSPTGFGGLAVDARLRVTDRTGAPIPGLYAAGEIIGMGATSGRAYCSGMSLGPALAFGRLLGQRLAAHDG